MSKRDPFIGDLSPEQMIRVMRHPALARNLRIVTYLLTKLDACKVLDDYMDFQGELLQATLKAHADAGEIDRQESRSLVGKGIKGLTDWPLALDPANATPAEWEIERLVANRVLRQIRAVGDALAWRVYGYDRGAITVLASNQSPGRIVDKTGLHSELGVVLEAWQKRKCFALLHDLTSVLRIGDVTEFGLDGTRQILEVKSSTNAKTGRQRRRMQEAVDAINGRAPLPKIEPTHPTFYLFRSSVPLRTNLPELRKLMERADIKGEWTGRVGKGRVAGVINLIKTADDPDHELRFAEFQLHLARAMRRHMPDSIQHLRVASPDHTARRADTAPFGIFPLPVATRAQLICDYVVFDARLAVEQLAVALERQGLQVEVPLPQRSSQHSAWKAVLHIFGNGTRLTLHGAGLHNLLLEFTDLDCYAAATAEMISSSDIRQRPLLMFAGERHVWR
jgi:hypothetical protein